MSDWKEWRWTPEKPYPETLDTLVYVRFGDGYETDAALRVEFFHGTGEADNSNWRIVADPEAAITHYRVVEAA